MSRSAPLLVLAALSLGSLTTTACKKAEEVALPAEKKVKVTTAPVKEAPAPQFLRLTGSLRGAQETDLAANVNGRVQATFVERGDEVKKGTLIAQVDTLAAALSLAEARVQVQSSTTQQEINQKDCERYEQLHAKGAVSELEYDQVTARCKTAPLSIEAAKARESIAAKNVGDGAIRAPFAGVVTERFVEVGEYVQTPSRVVSLAQVKDLKLEFTVPEANFPDVKRDAVVRFRVAAYSDLFFEGRVVNIAAAMRATRDFVVEAKVDNAELKLAPGMFADVELAVREKAMPFLPKEAVFEQNGRTNVLVVANGFIEQRVIQVDPAFALGIPVRRGLRAGELIIPRYESTLKNGQAVE